MLITIASFLSGCLATTDMLRDRGALPNDLYDTALTMTQLGSKKCIKTTGYQGQSKDDWTKGRKLDTADWVVRRFYIGSDNWFKAEASSQGIIGNIYFNKNTFQFVCGDHQWNTYSDTSGIIFKEYGKEPKVLIKSLRSDYDGMSKEKYCSIARKIGPEGSAGVTLNKNWIEQVNDKCGSVEAPTTISRFRNTLSQIKYNTDFEFCKDLKFGLEILLGKVGVESDPLRYLAVSEVFEELSSFSSQDLVLSECRGKYF